MDVRFFGETHTPETSPHVFSSFIEVESEEGATSALEFLEADLKKPCPKSCATQISNFDVGDIAEAHGVHRIATAEDIAQVGATEQRPRDSYWVGLGRRSNSDVGEHEIERARHAVEVESLDEPSSVVNLAAAAGTHEASELLVGRAPMLRRLLLEDSK